MLSLKTLVAMSMFYHLSIASQLWNFISASKEKSCPININAQEIAFLLYFSLDFLCSVA